MSSFTVASPRILSATGLGLVVTVGLFFVMTILIRGDETLVFVAQPLTTISFLPALEDEPVPRKPRVEPPPAPTTPPTTVIKTNTTETFVPIGDEWTRPGSLVGKPKLEVSVSDGEAVPLVTSVPEYPTRAVSKGIEGWVIVEFAIDPQGKVFAPRVIEGQPSGIFDNAALKAIGRYKYKPRVINGKGVSVEGIRQRIVFELNS